MFILELLQHFQRQHRGPQARLDETHLFDEMIEECAARYGVAGGKLRVVRLSVRHAAGTRPSVLITSDLLKPACYVDINGAVMKVQVPMTKIMSRHGDDAFRKKVLTCTHVLNGMLCELQARYGRDAVVAAVMEIAGCSVCIADKTAQGRAEGLRTLLDRAAAHSGPSPKRN